VVPMYMSRVVRTLACPAMAETSLASSFQVTDDEAAYGRYAGPPSQADLWEENGRRWQALDLDTATRAQVDGYMSLAAQFATTSAEVLALADEIAGGIINKVMAKSDLELGIEALHRDGPI
jgi:hypothetical protein